MIAKLLKPVEVQITPHNFAKFVIDFEAALKNHTGMYVWEKDTFVYGILIKKIKKTGKESDHVEIMFDDGDGGGTVEVPGWKVA